MVAIIGKFLIRSTKKFGFNLCFPASRELLLIVGRA